MRASGRNDGNEAGYRRCKIGSIVEIRHVSPLPRRRYTTLMSFGNSKLRANIQTYNEAKARGSSRLTSHKYLDLSAYFRRCYYHISHTFLDLLLPAKAKNYCYEMITKTGNGLHDDVNLSPKLMWSD